MAYEGLKDKKICCRSCSLIQLIHSVPARSEIRCFRCESVLLGKSENSIVSKNPQYVIALGISCLIFFIIFATQPLLLLRFDGHMEVLSIYSSIVKIYNQDQKTIAIILLLTTIISPCMYLVKNLYILIPSLNNTLLFKEHSVIFFQRLSDWEMLGVFFLGILISIVKLSSFAEILPGLGLWALIISIYLLTIIRSGTDHQFPIDNHVTFSENQTQNHQFRNVNFPQKIHPSSRSLALLIAAVILIIPANFLPIMHVTTLTDSSHETILGGIIFLAYTGSWHLALIVFIASFLIPILKLLTLAILLIMVRWKKTSHPMRWTRFYHLAEFIGKWSMVDIYVVALMSALIQIQGVAVIEIGPGAIPFAAVIVLTVFALKSFDIRLIWAPIEQEPN